MPQPAQRADARRNRERILHAAREQFADRGTTVPLDDIARRAGIGPGTLHRHFPTKTALLTAVLLVELEERVAEAEGAVTAPDPGDAFFRLLDHMLSDGVRSKALKEALTGAGLDLRELAPEAFAALAHALDRALRTAQQAGVVRPDINVTDVLSLLAGALAARTHAQAASASPTRAAALVLDALRTR